MALKIRLSSTVVSRFSAWHLNRWLPGDTTSRAVQATDQHETSDSWANDVRPSVYGLLVAPPRRY